MKKTERDAEQVSGGSLGGETVADATRLAVVLAALDQEREYSRADVLVSIVVETLANGPLTGEQIHQYIGRSFATDAVTPGMLDRALAVASELRLIHVRSTAGDIRWALSPQAQADATRYQDTANQIFVGFATDLAERAFELADVTLPEQQVDGLAHKFFCGLIDATENSYRPAASLAEDFGDLRIQPKRVLDTLRTMHAYEGMSSEARKRLSDAVPRLVAAVLDPTDPFGNDLLQLLSAGNVLRSLLRNRDLGREGIAPGTRIALDTSTLVAAAEEGTPARMLFDEMVKRSIALGVEVVVFEHTMSEYERLWEAAEAEMKGTSCAGGDLDRLQKASVLIRSPFVREYLRQREATRNLLWERFRLGRHNLTALLDAQGVVILAADGYDTQLADSVEKRLLSMSKNPRIKGRSNLAAEADGVTTAAVAQWRAERPADPASAWFVANERLTQRAFAEVKDDPYPLVVPPEAWLMYVSRLGDGDPSAIRSLATTLGNATRRASFLAVASSFQVEDVLRFSAMLEEKPGEGVTTEDLRRSVQLDFVDFLGTADPEGRGELAVRDYADRVLRDRTRRQEYALARAQAETERIQEHHEAELVRATEVGRAEEQVIARAREKDFKEAAGRERDEALSLLEEDKDRKRQNDLDEAARTHRRQLQLVLIGVLAAALIVVNLLVLPGTSRYFRVPSAAVSVILVGTLTKKVLDGQSFLRFLLEILVVSGFTAAELSIGKLWF